MLSCFIRAIRNLDKGNVRKENYYDAHTHKTKGKKNEGKIGDDDSWEKNTESGKRERRKEN